MLRTDVGTEATACAHISDTIRYDEQAHYVTVLLVSKGHSYRLKLWTSIELG